MPHLRICATCATAARHTFTYCPLWCSGITSTACWLADLTPRLRGAAAATPRHTAAAVPPALPAFLYSLHVRAYAPPLWCGALSCMA